MVMPIFVNSLVLIPKFSLFVQGFPDSPINEKTYTVDIYIRIHANLVLLTGRPGLPSLPGYPGFPGLPYDDR